MFRLPSLVAFALALLTGAASHAAWPDRPLRLVVPYVAGSPADTVGRVMAEGLAKRLGQPVVVENRTGASAQIGTEAAARLPADGYSLLLGNLDSHVLNALLYSKLRYQPEKDFTPISMVGVTYLALVGSTSLDAKNAAELIAAAKKSPGKLNFGTWGNGSAAHVWMALLEQTAGIQLTHIPFPGTPQALNALMGQQIELMFLSPVAAAANQQAGKLRVIGTTGPKRSALQPDLPTLAEQPGFAGFEASTWFGLYAPAGLAADITQRLNAEVNAVLRTPEVAEKFGALALQPTGSDPAGLARTMADDRAKWGRVITERKIQLLD